VIGSSREQAFVERRRADWDALDRLVQAAQGGRLRGISGEDIGRLVTLYRDVCADLARAQAARYSAGLVDWLQGLTRSAHAAVYGAKARAWSVDLRDFFTAFRSTSKQ